MIGLVSGQRRWGKQDLIVTNADAKHACMIIRRPRNLGIEKLALKSIGRLFYCDVMHGPMYITSTTTGHASMEHNGKAFALFRLCSEQCFWP